MDAISDDVIEAVCRQFSRDGMEAHLLKYDSVADTVVLELEYGDVECMDCVMPAEYLCGLVASSFQRRLGREITVTLLDPRHAEPVTVLPKRTVGDEVRRAAGLVVLDPTARRRDGDPDPGPDVGKLKGKTFGFRVDELWKAFDWVVDEWSIALRSGGAEVKSWRRMQGVPGERGARLQAEYEEFVESVDVLVSGLGNCGSCTSWTVKDALNGLNLGLPTIAVATAQFEDLARVSAEYYLRPGLRLHVLPYPIHTQPEDDVREIARAALPAVLSTLGAVL